MRFRHARRADLSTLLALLGPGYQPSNRVRERQVDIWQTMLADGSMRMTLVEDPALPESDAVQMIGASVFLRDHFFENYISQPQQGLPELLYEEILAGNSPVLSADEIRRANSHEGLHLLMAHFALRNPDLSDPKTQELMFAVNSAFFFFYGGYRLKTAMQEVYGRQAAEYMKAGGFRIADHFDAPLGSKDEPSPDVHRYLLLLRREEIQPSAVNPLSFLFYPMQPRIHFSGSEQKVLELALLNQSDAEIASDIGVSLDAVKKTWRRAFERVSRTSPHLLAGDEASATLGARGVEKRRHLLDYLRIHLEELRPHDASP